METSSQTSPSGPAPSADEPAGSGRVDTDPAGPTQDERTWALLAHALALVGSFLAPLIIWLVKKEDSDYVADHALESLNFQITVALASAVAGGLVCLGIGLVLLPVIFVGDLVLVILATLKASAGERYRYPLSWRLIR